MLQTAEQRIGDYQLLRPIGHGGMGAVYDALKQPEGLRVAVKILHPRFAVDADLVQRFFNEARAASAIAHPGIVRVFGSGRQLDGTCFIAMEYLDGEPLSQRLRRSGGSLGAEAVRIGQQVADALAAAHLKGILHRDLKPSNVMLVPVAGGAEQAKVIDFGIAKVQADVMQEADQEFRTRTGSMLGTPVYMSPEQCRGVKQDDRTDVYSLGVLLYQMLVGRPPFVSQADGDVIAMHILVPPLPPRSLNPQVPEGLSQLLLRMLAKAPAERPSMVEVAAALATLALVPEVTRLVSSGRPHLTMVPAEDAPTTLATPTSSLTPESTPAALLRDATPMPRPLSGRRRLMQGLGAAVATLLVAGSVGGAWLLRQAPPPVTGSSGSVTPVEATSGLLEVAPVPPPPPPAAVPLPPLAPVEIVPPPRPVVRPEGRKADKGLRRAVKAPRTTDEKRSPQHEPDVVDFKKIN